MLMDYASSSSRINIMLKKQQQQKQNKTRKQSEYIDIVHYLDNKGEHKQSQW